MSQTTIDDELDIDPSPTGSVFISQIQPINFLSFGPDTEPIELRSLNVLIGANGSGKSNLIEAIAFLRAAPTGFQKVTGAGGGVSKWIYKGNSDQDASVLAILNYNNGESFLQHTIDFRPNNYAFQLTNESITDVIGLDAASSDSFLAVNHNGRIEISGGQNTVNIDSTVFSANASILALYRNLIDYPQLNHLADKYSNICIYRNWHFGRDNVLRGSQRADALDDRLEEDYSNLGVFLSRLFENPAVKDNFREHLRDIYAGLEDIKIDIIDEAFSFELEEKGYPISAVRLSDGTLRYIALLAILCDPTPPPLICIEEPEIGLHPDLIHTVADLLQDASRRTQLIITTHSDILVDALSKDADKILVCEKWEGKTEVKRLEPEELEVWLKEYSLGQLWRRGQLGGTRW